MRWLRMGERCDGRVLFALFRGNIWLKSIWTSRWVPAPETIYLEPIQPSSKHLKRMGIQIHRTKMIPRISLNQIGLARSTRCLHGRQGQAPTPHPPG